MPDSDLTTILFDLDGTLIDTVELIMASYRHTVIAHGYTPVPDDVWLQNLGIPLRVQFRHFTEEPDEIQAMIATYLKHNLENHDDMVGHYSGVRRRVVGLKDAGYRLGLVTSKMHGGLEKGLAAGGYEGVFEVLIGADDVTNAKPHPEPVLLALERLGVEPANAVFVGDSPHDMAAGRAAGVRTAAALWGPFDYDVLAPEEPTYWLETAADLERFFVRPHPHIG